ncbi:MAG: hypothetical protein L0Y55_04805, partial [Anaerolineales bacterium]|nr:hypothetical protein [Anaerolineales bacterium]
NFIAAPAFTYSSVCGHQGFGLLAHETGHYLGLRHPFPQVFKNIQEAENYMRAHGNKPSAFDGDGLEDTPPDPYIQDEKIQCGTVTFVNVNGIDFPLLRSNIMTYYDHRSTLTPQQIERARKVMEARLQNGMAIPPNFR